MLAQLHEADARRKPKPHTLSFLIANQQTHTLLD